MVSRLSATLSVTPGRNVISIDGWLPPPRGVIRPAAWFCRCDGQSIGDRGEEAVPRQGLSLGQRQVAGQKMQVAYHGRRQIVQAQPAACPSQRLPAPIFSAEVRSEFDAKTHRW